MVLILSSAFVFAIAKIRFILLIYKFLRTILLKKKHLDCLRGSIMTHLRKFVSSVPEYRRTSRGNFKHKLEDILMLVILGRLSKCITRAELYENGRNPDIVSAYSLGSGFTLATDVCKEKSNEIKSVPRLLDKLIDYQQQD